MASKQDIQNAIKMFQQALDLFKLGDNHDSLKQWTQKILPNHIRIFEAEILSTTNVQKKLSLQSTMASCKVILNHLKSLQIRVGRGLAETSKTPDIIWDDLESAFESRIKTGVITNLKHLDIHAFLNSSFVIFKDKVKSALKEHNSIKVNVTLNGEYTKLKKVDGGTNEHEEEVKIMTFNTKNKPIFLNTNLSDWYQTNVKEPIDKKMSEFQERDSGWTLRRISSLIVNYNKFNPLRGNSYLDLPDKIERKRACINVKNEHDNMCFKWATLSAVLIQFEKNPDFKQNAERVTKYYPYTTYLNFKGIQFPTPLSDIPKFEKQNNISVNVFMIDKTKDNNFDVSPCYVSQQKKEKHVNLLLIDKWDEKNERLNFHYVWIKDLGKLFHSQVTKSHKKIFVCDRCLHFFYNSDKLIEHEKDCGEMNKCRIDLPKEDEKILKFTKYQNQHKMPYVVYSDFECLLESVDENDVSAGNNRACNKHTPFSVGMYIQCSYDEKQSCYKSYRQGLDGNETPAKWFIEQLNQLAAELDCRIIDPEKLPNLTPEESRQFKEATTCHICQKAFKPDEVRVRDHDHFSGAYRGCAHQSCNLNYKAARVVPVIFHNLSGYDAHLFITELATYFEGDVKLLAQTKERYISFTKYMKEHEINIRFIDSFKFLACSLEKLASYLPEHKIIHQVFGSTYSSEKIKLLLRKGVYPYEYTSSLDTLQEKKLPPKAAFYSKLTDSDISEEDYQHACKIWREFEIKNLGEYSDLYLKTDVILLADVFEDFRRVCMQDDGLDPAHYYTIPGLSWDSMLKKTNIELELITDIDILLFQERAIRGGISQCCNRFAKANNSYMAENYNSDEPETYIMYWDANNLYGLIYLYLSYSNLMIKKVDNFNYIFLQVGDDTTTTIQRFQVGDESNYSKLGC